MGNNQKVKRVNKALLKLDKATNNLLLAKARRKWIESNSKINLLNYFYYRYLTNEFELWLLKSDSS